MDTLTRFVIWLMDTSVSEAKLDESQTSSDKPAGTKESEMVCAESQPCLPETAPFDSMTAGDKSGAGVEELEVTLAESQSGSDILFETDTNLFLAGGERSSL